MLGLAGDFIVLADGTALCAYEWMVW